jgi:hypothetical protein
MLENVTDWALYIVFVAACVAALAWVLQHAPGGMW